MRLSKRFNGIRSCKRSISQKAISHGGRLDRVVGILLLSSMVLRDAEYYAQTAT